MKIKLLHRTADTFFFFLFSKFCSRFWRILNSYCIFFIFQDIILKKKCKLYRGVYVVHKQKHRAGRACSQEHLKLYINFKACLTGCTVSLNYVLTMFFFFVNIWHTYKFLCMHICMLKHPQSLVWSLYRCCFGHKSHRVVHLCVECICLTFMVYIHVYHVFQNILHGRD